MNKGTWTTAPVSTVAALVTLLAVSPFIPGSVSTIRFYQGQAFQVEAPNFAEL